MISYSIFPISIVFCTLKNPQNDTKIIILPLLVKKLWNGLKRMAAILFLCKWGQKVLVGHASMSEMICMTINYYHAKLNNSTQKCRVHYILDRLHGPLARKMPGIIIFVPVLFSKSFGNFTFNQIFGHQRAEIEARNTKMNRGEETLPMRMNATCEMKWVNIFFKMFWKFCLQTAGRAGVRVNPVYPNSAFGIYT